MQPDSSLSVVGLILAQTTFTLRRIFLPIKKKLDRKTDKALDDGKVGAVLRLRCALSRVEMRAFEMRICVRWDAEIWLQLSTACVPCGTCPHLYSCSRAHSWTCWRR